MKSPFGHPQGRMVNGTWKYYGQDDFLPSVRGASTANIADLSAASTTLDGLTLVEGDRILLKDQSTGAQNGLYEVGAVSGGAAPLTRTLDALSSGAVVHVEAGTANGDKNFQLTTNETITVGTTALTFEEFTANAVPTFQFGTATLASGTVTVNSGITLAASSHVMVFVDTAITGSTNFATVHEDTAQRSLPGTMVIEALGDNGALDADAAGIVKYVIITPAS